MNLSSNVYPPSSMWAFSVDNIIHASRSLQASTQLTKAQHRPRSDPFVALVRTQVRHQSYHYIRSFPSVIGTKHLSKPTLVSTPHPLLSLHLTFLVVPRLLRPIPSLCKLSEQLCAARREEFLNRVHISIVHLVGALVVAELDGRVFLSGDEREAVEPLDEALVVTLTMIGLPASTLYSDRARQVHGHGECRIVVG